jgi:hypothetical protein
VITSDKEDYFSNIKLIVQERKKECEVRVSWSFKVREIMLLRMRIPGSTVVQPVIGSRLMSNTRILCAKSIEPRNRNATPLPTEDVPDVATFLTRIGRNMIEHVDNFESWESLMTATTYDLKNKGIDTRPRRYLLAWRERFIRGQQLTEHHRGKKRWGGERKREEVRARHFGGLKAEQTNKP